MKIYKYQLDYVDKQTIKAKILKPLSVQMQDKKVCLWAIVDEAAIDQESTITMYGTGAEVDRTKQMTYISTLQIGSFVFHYFIDGLY